MAKERTRFADEIRRRLPRILSYTIASLLVAGLHYFTSLIPLDKIVFPGSDWTLEWVVKAALLVLLVFLVARIIVDASVLIEQGVSFITRHLPGIHGGDTSLKGTLRVLTWITAILLLSAGISPWISRIGEVYGSEAMILIGSTVPIIILVLLFALFYELTRIIYMITGRRIDSWIEEIAGRIEKAEVGGEKRRRGTAKD